MNKIEFNKTSNIFINIGIIGLYHYLRKFKRKKNQDFTFDLSAEKLLVESEDVLSLLEEVYYFMGKEIYDTPSKKQLNQKDKWYFKEEPFEYGEFPKMNSFGLAGFVTKAPFGPQPTPKIKPVKFSHLLKSKPDFAKKIANVFFENDKSLKGFKINKDEIKTDSEVKKGDSQIYLNEPYTKTPRIEFKSKFFETGSEYCSVTKENFKELVSSKGAFSFTANVTSFNSFLQSDDNIKISLKAKYLALFAPALAMYSYYDGYEHLTAAFFNTNSLKNLYNLYPTDFFYDKDEMQSWNYSFKRNVKFHNFYYAKKHDESYTIDSGEDSYSAQEITFLILLTFYKKKFSSELNQEESEPSILDEVLSSLNIENNPLSLVTFKADKFASTLRPNFYEEYTNAKFIIQLIHKLETNEDKRVPIKELWRGLVFKTQKSEAVKDYSKKMRLQRQIRIDTIDHILKGKSILKIIETLFQKSYLLLTNNDNPGFRRYDLILEFLKIYQSTLNIMEKSLQERAIGLGKSIGYAILNHDDNDKKANAKNGRKYLISLHKSRTIEQFRATLIRIQTRYGVSIANEILENLNEKNYIAIKQYAQIGALNSLNTVLSNQNNN